MRAVLVPVDAAEAVRASGDHPLIAHLTASPADPPLHWRLGRAVALADDYWGRVNLCAIGPVTDVVALVDAVAHLDYWMSVPAEAAAELPEHTLGDRHGWAFRWTTTPTGVRRDAASWLHAGDEPELSELLDAAFPAASVRVGHRRARRWAGVRDGGGELVACAVDATQHPEVGFVASIATRPDARGQGFGTLVTGWLVDRLVEERGRAALWVDQDNPAANAVYDRLAMTELRMTAGALRGSRHTLSRES
jgi:ribosomal protein S18 acetylase RimI-like enzyme